MGVPPSDSSVVSFDFQFTLKVSKQEAQLSCGSRRSRTGTPPFTSPVAVAVRWRMLNKNHNKPRAPTGIIYPHYPFMLVLPCMGVRGFVLVQKLLSTNRAARSS